MDPVPTPTGKNPCAEIQLPPSLTDWCRIGWNIAIRVMLMPKDLNHHGVAFGGWVLAQMDLAGAQEARQHTQHDVVTRYMNGIEFAQSIKAGDVVTFYTHLVKIGNTSITVRVNVEASRDGRPAPVAVTGAEFVYVTVEHDAEGNIHKVPVKDPPTPQVMFRFGRYGEMSDNHLICVDENFTDESVAGAVVGLNNGSLRVEDYSFCPPDAYMFTSGNAPCIVYLGGKHAND